MKSSYIAMAAALMALTATAALAKPRGPEFDANQAQNKMEMPAQEQAAANEAATSEAEAMNEMAPAAGEEPASPNKRQFKSY